MTIEQLRALVRWIAGVQFMVGGVIITAVSPDRWISGVFLMIAGLPWLFAYQRAVDAAYKNQDTAIK